MIGKNHARSAQIEYGSGSVEPHQQFRGPRIEGAAAGVHGAVYAGISLICVQCAGSEIQRSCPSNGEARRVGGSPSQHHSSPIHGDPRRGGAHCRQNQHAGAGLDHRGGGRSLHRECVAQGRGAGVKLERAGPGEQNRTADGAGALQLKGAATAKHDIPGGISQRGVGGGLQLHPADGRSPLVAIGSRERERGRARAAGNKRPGAANDLRDGEAEVFGEINAAVEACPINVVRVEVSDCAGGELELSVREGQRRGGPGKVRLAGHAQFAARQYDPAGEGVRAREGHHSRAGLGERARPTEDARVGAAEPHSADGKRHRVGPVDQRQITRAAQRAEGHRVGLKTKRVRRGEGHEGARQRGGISYDDVHPAKGNRLVENACAAQDD